MRNSILPALFILSLCCGILVPVNSHAQGCCKNGVCITAANKIDCEINLKGAWLGGKPCTSTACTELETCCYPVFNCAQLTAEQCHDVDGIYERGVNCNYCAEHEQVGACCLYEISSQSSIGCVALREAECKAITTYLTLWRPTACKQTQCPATYKKDQPGNFFVEANEGFSAQLTPARDAVHISWRNPFGDSAVQFFVARSRDARNFTTIGLLYNAAGQVQSEMVDNYPLVEGYYRVTYYRNGRDYVSQTIAVFNIEPGKLVLAPNPSTGRLRVLLAGMENFDTELSIHDAAGRMVLQQRLRKGEHHELNLSTLQPGSFIVRATQNGVVYVSKLLKH